MKRPIRWKRRAGEAPGDWGPKHLTWVYSPRLGWAVVSKLRLQTLFEKLIQKLQLIKLLNQALCFENFLISIRECGSRRETLRMCWLVKPTYVTLARKLSTRLQRRNARPPRPPPMPADSFSRTFGEAMRQAPEGYKRRGGQPLAARAHHQKTLTTRHMPTTRRP